MPVYQQAENSSKLLREDPFLGNPIPQPRDDDDYGDGFPRLLKMIDGSYSFFDPDDFFESGESNGYPFKQENTTATYNSSFPDGFPDSENHTTNEIVVGKTYTDNPHTDDSFFHNSYTSSPQDSTTVDISKLIIAAEKKHLKLAEYSTSSHGVSSTDRCITTGTVAGDPPPAPALKSILSRRTHPQAELVKRVSFRSKGFINGDSLDSGSKSSEYGGEDDDAKINAAITPRAAPNSRPKTAPKPKEEEEVRMMKKKFFSQPNPNTTKLSGKFDAIKTRLYSGPVNGSQCKEMYDCSTAKRENYRLFETNPRQQISRLLSRRSAHGSGDQGEVEESHDGFQAGKAMSAGRYFDALKGPELDTLKDCEEPLLPFDQQWPFLLRFPISCFGICLGLGSQSILWKTLAMSESVSFLRIPLSINLILWYLASAALISISIVYGLKCLFYLEAVRREYYHPVRVNFFFAPWIACMFLALGAPPSIAASLHPAIWGVFTTPILLLELKIYGQWLSGGARRLSRVANPSTHLCLVGNFISALLASVAGWKEAAIFFWAVGCAHYLVLFVTLYQRLPSSEVMPKELHPIFFLFVAAPSAASVAWESINGRFDYVSRMSYFLALFLYSSLVVRLNFFYGFKFSLTWWAYTFPMTALAIATIHYSLEVKHPITQALAVALSFISSVVVFSLFATTVVLAARGSLFSNDVAIAIATKRHSRRGRKGVKEAGGPISCKSNFCSGEGRSNSEKCGNKVVLAKEGGVLVASVSEDGHVSIQSTTEEK